MHLVRTADIGDTAARRDAARQGRAAAMSRRRALAAGRSALAPAHERVRTGFREAELRAPATVMEATSPAAADGRGASTHGSLGGTAVATDGVADAHLGRALSVQRRRQLSKGKQALNGHHDRTAAAGDAVAPTFIVYRGGGG